MSDLRTKVLIVEDDSVFRRGLVRLFENENCKVLGFEDADSALDSIRRNAPDFIVCDYKLPGMNGLDLLRKMRSEQIDAPFVLLTAHFSDELEAEAVENGAAAAVAKPLQVAGLRDLLRSQTGHL